MGENANILKVGCGNLTSRNIFALTDPRRDVDFPDVKTYTFVCVQYS